MQPLLCRFLPILLAFYTSLSFAGAQAPAKPLRENELLALVAGNALSENISHEIKARGVAFTPSDQYTALLATTGADAAVMEALRSAAKAGPRSGGSRDTEEAEALRHIAMAGKLMRAKQYEPAARELNAVLRDDPSSPEAGFVMGELLQRQEQFALAVDVYKRVLQEAQDFPEAQTKLSYNLYRIEALEDAMQAARAALARTPDNAEAHKNVGLVLYAERKNDAAIVEYREALRIKPDYAAVHFDMALVLGKSRKVEAAIAEYKEAIALDPTNVDCHYDFAILLAGSGDGPGAVREYREAKALDPERLDVRHNLALLLADLDVDASIREFRELIAMAPDFEMAHVGLGLALSKKGDSESASAEFRKASELDPADPIPHSNLGSELEEHGKYDAAMAEFVRAAQLDENSFQAHAGEGTIYLERKDYPNAVRELRLAESLDASPLVVHDNLAAALEGMGDTEGAIAEYRQAERIARTDLMPPYKLGPLLEKKGDFAGALEEYRRYADLQPQGSGQADYKAAQQRFEDKVKSLRAAGRNSEADSLQASLTAKGSEAKDLESQWNDALAGVPRDLADRRYADAEQAARSALALAERMRPRDRHLLQSIELLARIYMFQNRLSEAQVQWQHQLDVSQELFGPLSLDNAHALEGLGGTAYLQKDYASSVNFYSRAIEISEKTVGPTEPRLLLEISWLAMTYQAQAAFDKAEPLILRALRARESSGEPPFVIEQSVRQLGQLYLAWGKLDKAEAYCRRSLAMREKQYGAESPMLADPLQTLADVLTKLNREPEAAQLRKRREIVLASEGQPRQ